jgi:hypothetical protein
VAEPEKIEERLREHLRDARIYTVTDANALVPVLSEVATAIRDAYREMEDATEQIADFESNFSAELQDPAWEQRSEYDEYRKRFAAAREELSKQMERLGGLGAELKDPRIGLVDFYARRAGGETVYLCWKLGEDRIRTWHTLSGGYAGRRPVEEL